MKTRGQSQIASITGGNIWFTVSKCSIPFLRSPTGTMGNNGAFTSGTALPKTYLKGYMYFAANQIAAGVVAGWYPAVGSSTTAFTIYNNPYTSGTPTWPSSLTAFVTTGPGATTGDLTEQGPIPGLGANLIGTVGGFRMRARFTHANSVGNKTHRIRFSGVGGTQLVGAAYTTTTAAWAVSETFAQQSAAVQESAASIFSTGANTVVTQGVSTSVDMTAATTVSPTTQLAASTDYAVMEWYVLEALTDGT